MIGAPKCGGILEMSSCSPAHGEGIWCHQELVFPGDRGDRAGKCRRRPLRLSQWFGWLLAQQLVAELVLRKGDSSICLKDNWKDLSGCNTKKTQRINANNKKERKLGDVSSVPAPGEVKTGSEGDAEWENDIDHHAQTQDPSSPRGFCRWSAASDGRAGTHQQRGRRGRTVPTLELR